MTTPDTPAKKVIAVEILHLDETGYGPEGKHTRREWRAECLAHFEKGAEAFLAWQESWQAKAEQNDIEVNFGVRLTFDDGSREQLFDSEMQRHGLDFAGHTFKKYVDVQGYQFLNQVLFFATIFTDGADFRKTTFTGDADFHKTTFTGDAYFGKTTFKGDAYFSETTFTDRADFGGTTFEGGPNFRGTTFTGNATFNETTFKDYAAFIETTFTGHANFIETTFTNHANFRGTTFTGRANFSKTTFKDYAGFHATTFTSKANFESANFEGLTDFLTAKFHNQTHFSNAKFKGASNFENATFANVGHFEGAKFKGKKAKIPSFRGVDVGNTRLEFSDDAHFTQADFSEEAVKNIQFLKHLSEQHGQIDQALNFNAMELRAKYLQGVEPLREKSLPWFKRTFKRFFNSAWWALRLTWLYWKVSDFGRSYLKPSLWFVGLFAVTCVLAAGIATTHKPDNCRYQQFGLISELKCDGAPPKKQKASEAGKDDEKLYLDGYDAAFNYAMYHATGLIDFTGDSKLKDAINQRLFDEPIKPWWARLVGALLSLLNTALLFLIALGLRNNYRLR